MIVVKVELWPGGKESESVHLGTEKTPLCVKHFDMFMEGFGKVVKHLTGILGGSDNA